MIVNYFMRTNVQLNITWALGLDHCANCCFYPWEHRTPTFFFFFFLEGVYTVSVTAQDSPQEA